MSTPQDPFAAPGGEPQAPATDQPSPSYGGASTPAYGMPPVSADQYGQPSGAWQGPPLANWPYRVGSALIDTIIQVAIQSVFSLIGGGQTSALGRIGSLAGLAFAIWNLVRQGRTGQTVGKQVVGTRLLREQDGQVVGAGLSIGRSFLHIVDLLPCFLGFLWPLWDAKKQTFADKILSTVVIKA